MSVSEKVICEYVSGSLFKKPCDDYPDKCDNCKHNIYDEYMKNIVIGKVSYYERR